MNKKIEHILLGREKKITEEETEEVSAYHLIVFSKDDDNVQLYANVDTQILFLSAEPINEPVAAKDNFVMNSQEEVEQAIADYRNGVFGTLSA